MDSRVIITKSEIMIITMMMVFQHQDDVQQKGAKVRIGSPSQRNPAGRNEQRPLDQCK